VFRGDGEDLCILTGRMAGPVGGRGMEEKDGSSSVGKGGWGRRKREIPLHRSCFLPPSLEHY